MLDSHQSNVGTYNLWNYKREEVYRIGSKSDDSWSTPLLFLLDNLSQRQTQTWKDKKLLFTHSHTFHNSLSHTFKHVHAHALTTFLTFSQTINFSLSPSLSHHSHNLSHSVLWLGVIFNILGWVFEQLLLFSKSLLEQAPLKAGGFSFMRVWL